MKCVDERIFSDDETMLVYKGTTFVFEPVDGFMKDCCNCDMTCNCLHDGDELDPKKMYCDDERRKDGLNGYWKLRDVCKVKTTKKQRIRDTRTEDEKSIAEMLLG
jgi:hypothetical protein